MDNQQQNEEQPAKMGENPGAIEHVKSITNINYNCLERIFEFLDLKSLLNVANTCKRLQIAAAAYYGDIHGKRTVCLTTQRNCFWIVPGIFHHFHGKIYTLVDRKFCLPFLRCFGPKILQLYVFSPHYPTKEDNYPVRYINQYCAKTLKRISFEPYLGNPENFPNSFEFVEEVRMAYSELKEQLPHLVNLFPKLRKLDFDIAVDENCAAVHFPNLENLTIVFREDRFTMKNLLDLLHANPQLQKLDLGMTRGEELTMNELLNTISQNPLITKLKLNFNTNINPADLMRFASERPHTVELELDLQSHRIPPQDAINFIRELKLLKIFRFSINGQAEYDQLVSQLDIEWQHEINSDNNNNIITLKR